MEAPTSHKIANESYNALLKLIDLYDGYASENGVEPDDRYWGNMESLNNEIDAVIGSSESTLIKKSSDIITHWSSLVSIAKKIVDGAEGIISERGEVDRYAKAVPSKIRNVKKMFF
jgi:hypothetical protein